MAFSECRCFWASTKAIARMRWLPSELASSEERALRERRASFWKATIWIMLTRRLRMAMPMLDQNVGAGSEKMNASRQKHGTEALLPLPHVMATNVQPCKINMRNMVKSSPTRSSHHVRIRLDRLESLSPAITTLHWGCSTYERGILMKRSYTSAALEDEAAGNKQAAEAAARIKHFGAGRTLNHPERCAQGQIAKEMSSAAQ